MFPHYWNDQSDITKQTFTTERGHHASDGVIQVKNKNSECDTERGNNMVQYT